MARRRALLSVSDKSGLVAFARALAAAGFELVSTGGTARTLRDGGLEVTDVAAITGLPEMLGGRVKTLHPAIHAGILARRDRAEDVAALEANGFTPIDVVAVNLYPFRETLQAGAGEEEAIEQIDIGGPALLRAAAKNWRHVAAVVDPADYPAVAGELSAGATSEGLRRELMAKVFAHTAAYDLAIAEHFATQEGGFPGRMGIVASLRQSLRYGENPHQRAGWYVREGGRGGLAAAAVLQGKALSYNNLVDLHAAITCSREFEGPAAVVVKHATPCGVARAAGIAEAYRIARGADETSAFGGIVALNRPVDGEAAAALAETFLEAVAAPDFTDDARRSLAGKKNLRLVALPEVVGPPLEIRSIGNGLLVQEPDVAPDDPASFRVVTRRQPTDEERRALYFAWRVVKHVRSNAVVFAAADRTLAIGGGQTSRVEAVETAARKGGPRLAGSAVASDGFFPFRDGLDAVARAGAVCVIQPGGSVRDAEVIAAADEHGLAMIFTGRRHFRH